MTHPDELLSVYLDGEATPAESRRVRAHLADCVHCRCHLYELNEMRAAVRSLPMLELPPGLIPHEDAGAGHRKRHRSIWLGAAAAVAAAVIAVASLVTAPQPIAVSDISRQFGARASLDSGSASMKLVIPRTVAYP
jgi:anti-sigma factor RsiW